MAGVDLGLTNPQAERLGADAQLPGDTGDGAVTVTPLSGGLGDEPDGSFTGARVDTAAGTGGTYRAVP